MKSSVKVCYRSPDRRLWPVDRKVWGTCGPKASRHAQLGEHTRYREKVGHSGMSGHDIAE
jgi:hypothetical protein